MGTIVDKCVEHVHTASLVEIFFWEVLVISRNRGLVAKSFWGEWNPNWPRHWGHWEVGWLGQAHHWFQLFDGSLERELCWQWLCILTLWWRSIAMKDRGRVAILDIVSVSFCVQPSLLVAQWRIVLVVILDWPWWKIGKKFLCLGGGGSSSSGVVH